MRYLIVWYTDQNRLRYARTRFPRAAVGLIDSIGGNIVNIAEITGEVK